MSRFNQQPALAPGLPIPPAAVSYGGHPIPNYCHRRLFLMAFPGLTILHCGRTNDSSFNRICALSWLPAGPIHSCIPIAQSRTFRPFSK